MDWYHTFKFLENVIKHPIEVGTFAPLSTKAVEEFLKDVPTANIRHIVELGAGTGAVTDQLVGRCEKLTLVEMNVDFVEILRQKYEKLNYVGVVCDDALNYMKHLYNDDIEYIICTLPFTNMNSEVANNILKNVKDFCDKHNVNFVAIQLSRLSKDLFDSVFGDTKVQYRYTEECFLPFLRYTVVTYVPPKKNLSIISIVEQVLKLLT